MRALILCAVFGLITAALMWFVFLLPAVDLINETPVKPVYEEGK